MNTATTKDGQHRILFDLSAAQYGYGGIAQDTRLIFKALAQLNDVTLGGLIILHQLGSFRDKLHTEYQNKFDKIMQQGSYLARIVSSMHQPVAKGVVSKLLRAAIARTRKNFSLAEIEPKLFDELIWRNYFEKTLSPEDFDLIVSQAFFLSDLNHASFAAALYDPRFNIKLNTDGWDFALFQDVRPVQVSPGTKKLVRYHDAVSITDSDVIGLKQPQKHMAGLAKCVKDSFFVCDSQTTREALHNITELPESKSAVVPCALSNIYKKVQNSKFLSSIFKTRLSNLFLDERKIEKIRAHLVNEPEFPYVLALSTLEPRKNFIAVIRAWERLKMQQKIPHKLVIVGNAGWKYEETAKAMLPHLENGDIIHLAGVAPDEIPYIFSHASAFAFLSYNEGFGLPPLEAMQCECPTIVSDIKVHREVMGDASLYCNPYDINSVAGAFEQLLCSSNSNSLQAELIKRGLSRVKLYTPEKIAQQWQQLFVTLQN